ncbi:MMPL family transporter [Amycolatopsis sp. CA-230715]|uniref:MMPL family transporter n=1 Tax=Amycolatopsis sp. CA-230715 TaxID=2745196 RepID=UPI001C035016|nr:MMPL family transporter [Amycolatopsis sp. CA-230715]QWF78175.1 Heme uptake protein MmpL11 [Amycolatopsis sp. CA-230715]
MLRTIAAPSSARTPVVERISDWSVRHRALAIAGWLVLVVLTVLISAVLPGHDAKGADPGESGIAKIALDAQREYEPLRENVLIQSRDAAELRATIEDLVTSLHGTEGAVAAVQSPSDSPNRISRDGSALLTFTLAGPDDRVAAHGEAAAAAVDAVAARHPAARLDQAGDRTLSSVVNSSLNDDVERAGLISVGVTLAILLLVFGALVAAVLPMLLAVTAVGGAFGLIALVAKVLPINSATNAIALLIGMAVGVDYTLFSVRRLREERAAGRSGPDALRITARTSGHVIVVSGVTVILCLSGMLVTGLDNLRGAGVGTGLVVGVAVLGAVTFLPALLSLLGNRIDRGRLPWIGGRRTAAEESRIWSAVARVVVRRPVLWGGTAALVLLVMALPALGMHLQQAASIDSVPRSESTVDSAVRVNEAFPGVIAPAKVVLWDSGGVVDETRVAGALGGLRARIAASGGLLAEPVTVVRVDRALVVRVPLAGSSTDPTSERALELLRNEVVPATFGQVPGVEHAVTGKTAIAYDFDRILVGRVPLVFGVVLALAFALLAFSFRSVVVPLISIALNLLSVGAAYGALTWIFQYGNLSGLFGFTSYGGVVSWLPMFLLVMLFGLSMDYHIFILSRIRERRAAGMGVREAVVDGIARSSGVVTSAAAIMTAVFAIFVLLDAIEYKMMGVSMALAILVDATLVRGVLLPAALTLFPPRAWKPGT